jgi:hypothetical protein
MVHKRPSFRLPKLLWTLGSTRTARCLNWGATICVSALQNPVGPTFRRYQRSLDSTKAHYNHTHWLAFHISSSALLHAAASSLPDAIVHVPCWRQFHNYSETANCTKILYSLRRNSVSSGARFLAYLYWGTGSLLHHHPLPAVFQCSYGGERHVISEATCTKPVLTFPATNGHP